MGCEEKHQRAGIDFRAYGLGFRVKGAEDRALVVPRDAREALLGMRGEASARRA